VSPTLRRLLSLFYPSSKRSEHVLTTLMFVGVHEPPQELLSPVRQLYVGSNRTTTVDRGHQSAAPTSADGQAGNAWPASSPVTTSIGATSTPALETVRSPAPLQPQQQQPQALGSSPLPPAAQTQAQQPQFPPGVKLETQRPPSALQQPAQRNAFPGSLSDLVASFEAVKQKGKHVSVDDLGLCRKEYVAMLTCACIREQRRIARTWTRYTSYLMGGTRICHSRRTPRSECAVPP
jgi:hypothetical protein